MRSMLLYPFNWTYNRVAQLYRYNFLYEPQSTIKTPSLEITIFALAWVLEWAIVIQYLLEEWWRCYIFQATRVPLILVLSLVYWFWLWTMSVWRRTQFGRFTRGERKLWAKALAAFWVAELVTVGSIVGIFGCLSWGPAPLVPRVFNVSRKSFLLELVVYSYIFIAAYIARAALKWNSWHTQVVLSCLVLMMLSYLLWRDVLLLMTRLNLYDQSAARWRNIRTTAVVYTLSHEWWTSHITGNRAPHARQESLLYLLQMKQRPDFSKLPQYTQYELHNFVEVRQKQQVARALCPLLSAVIDYTPQLQNSLKHAQPFSSYPRRVGFVPKRLGLWHLLVVLKMWHHLVLVLWWALYVYRLVNRQKTSYSFFNSCVFNVFCCLLLAFIVYALGFFPRLEYALQIKSTHFNFHRLFLCLSDGGDYVEDYFGTFYLEHAPRPQIA